MGRARRAHRHGRRVRRSPRVRPGARRAVSGGPRPSRRHRRAAAVDHARRRRPHGPAPALRRRERGQPRLDAQQAHRPEEGAVGGPVLARWTHEHAAQPRDASCTRTSAARPSPGCRSSSGASRRRCGASPTTTTGATRFVAPSCSTARPTSSSSAWGSSPRGRSRGGSARARTLDQLTDVRGTAHVAEEPPRLGEHRRGREPLRHRRQAVVSAVVRGRRQRQGGLREDVAHAAVRDERAQRAPAPAAARRRGGVLQPAGAAARRERDGRALRSPLRAQAALGLRRRENPRVRDRQELHRDDARLLRRVHVLQHHRARGADHPEPQRRQRAARGAGALAHGGVPRHDHRRRRPHREHVQDAVQGRRPSTPADASRACTPGICENLVTDHAPLISS